VDKSTGEMARTEQLLQMARAHGMHCVTIKDLIRYRVQHEPLTAGAQETVELSGLQLHGLQGIDGSKAAFVAFGDVTSNRPQVLLQKVLPS
jgi:hypothetical protein